MVDHYMVTIPDWENGTAGMTFEQEYVYRKLCEFIYALDDTLKDDDRANARRCKMSTRLFRKHKIALLEMGKIDAQDGYIRNRRCANELQKIWDRSEAARVKAAKSHVKRRANKKINSPTSPKKPSKFNGTPVAGALANEVTREERKNPPIVPPKPGGLDQAIGIWAEVLGDRLKTPPASAKRAKAFARRFVDEFGSSHEAFRQYCQQIRGSPFLCGENDRCWQANFDWALKPANIEKVVEGNYEQRAGTGNMTPEQALAGINKGLEDDNG